jgi:hypothetical protein
MLPESGVTEAGAGQAPANGRISREMLHEAAQLDRSFADRGTRRRQALPGINRNLTSYETLRRIDVPLDTELATLFNPALPGKALPADADSAAPNDGSRPGAFTKVEDLAFCTVTQLAELVRTRRVTSVELTADVSRRG